MKRIIIIFSFVVSALCTFALDTKKVAILEVVDKENKLSYHQKLMLRSSLAEEVNKAAGFEAYDRSNIDAIMKEHDFQRTGLVSQDQVRLLGEMAGAAYILVIEGAVSSIGNLFVSTTILDVETGQMTVSASENMETTESGLRKGCSSLARKLFAKLIATTETLAKEEERIAQEYNVFRDKKEYTYMGHKMNKKDYVNFIKANCSEAYKQYMKGTTFKKVGWAFFGIGLSFAVAGSAEVAITELRWSSRSYDMMNPDSPEGKKFRNQYNSYMRLGSIGIVVGGAMFVTSIPLISVGVAKQKKSVSIYNERCSSPSIPPLSFNLTAGQNGLGIAMQF